MGSVTSIVDLEVAGQPEPILALAQVPGMKPQPCIIMHYNRDGACLYAAVDLPDCFILCPVEGVTDRLCQVIWRTDDFVAVEFVNARTMGHKVALSLGVMPSNVVALFPQ